MVVLDTEDLAQQVFERLLRRGVIVRPLKATGLSNCLRVSVGTADQNEMCVDALKRVGAEVELDPYVTTHETI
jgi:histidinol-phosphate aminotransferase